MDILDKLFSRELTRRTGEKAIKIDTNEKAKTRGRAKFLGSSALKASTKKSQKPKKIKPSKNSKNPSKNSKTKPKNIPKPQEGSLFRRLNIRFPMLKFFAVLIIGTAAILDLLDFTISKTYDTPAKIQTAPMSRHVKVSARSLTGKKLIILTFDDGPAPATTPKLLDILKKKGVPATFFVLGTMAKKHPDIVKRIKSEGHTIASHTMYHQSLPRISSQAAAADINEAKSVIKNITGENPAFTRPPYGNYNAAIQKLIDTPIILWSVDTLDWKTKTTDSIVSTALSQAKDGGIILMHDIYPTTVDAVSTLIDKFRAAGFEFASIDEVAKIRGRTLSNTPYYSFYP